MQIGTVGSYLFVREAKLIILIYLVPHRKKGKLHLNVEKYRCKAYDAEVITNKNIAEIPKTSRRVDSQVLNIYKGVVYIRGRISMNAC